MNAEALERLLDVLSHQVDGIPCLARELRDVVAPIAVLGRLLPTSRRLDGLAEPVHLRAGVVVVVLALDLVAGEGEQSRDGVAVGAVARRRDGDRPRRVRGHHLDLDPLLRLGPATAGALAGVEDRAQSTREPGVGEKGVDEAGARDFGSLDVGQRLSRLYELRGELARRLTPRAGELQRGVRRVVAVFRVAGTLERDACADALGEPRDGISRQRSRAARRGPRAAAAPRWSRPRRSRRPA